MLSRSPTQPSLEDFLHIYVLVESSDLTPLRDTLESLFLGNSLLAQITILGSRALEVGVNDLLAQLPGASEINAVFFACDKWLAPHVIHYLSVMDVRHDLILIQAGVLVPFGWDARLSRVSRADALIGTVSPMCDALSLFSLIPVELQAQAIRQSIKTDNLLFQVSAKSYSELPCFFPGCFYIKRLALDVLKNQPETDDSQRGALWWDVARTIAMHGIVHVQCDHLYVDQSSSDCCELETFLNRQEAVSALLTTHPLTAVRHAFRDALEQNLATARMSGYDHRPVQLHLMHGWGGGLEQWVKDYCSTDSSRINLILKSVGTWGGFGMRLVLYLDENIEKPFKVWDLPTPIRATNITHFAYREVLDQIIAEFGVGALIISSLIGHSLDALSTGKPTLMVGHDYYPYCPAIIICYNGLCRSCEDEKLSQCFDRNPQNRFFKNISAGEWAILREAFIGRVLKNKIDFVAATPSFEQNLIQLDQRFKDVQFHQIPHGRSSEMPIVTAEIQPETKSRLRVLILGSLAIHKGGELLRSCYAELSEVAELYLVGCSSDGAFFENKKGVHVIQTYKREELYSIVDGIQPDVAMLLSVWPETFSYTLSECMEMGIPVVATNLGAFADRIQDNITGFLVEPVPQSLVAKLTEIDSDRTLLQEVKGRLAGNKHRGLEEMVLDYHEILPLPMKKAGDYAVTFAYGARQPRTVTAGQIRAVSFDTFMHENFRFLQERIASTPLLRDWQRKIASRVLKIMNSSLRFCYKTLKK